MLIYVISAFVAVRALRTSGIQALDTSSAVVVFDQVLDLGVMITFTSRLVCPSSAFYFVHYRLLVRPLDASQSCFIGVQAGGFEAPLSFTYS